MMMEINPNVAGERSCDKARRIPLPDVSDIVALHRGSSIETWAG
ncbi:MAG: hypothetical protein OSB26_06545 [Woeseiaceae bacterium]|nr:hypothetical protein [Woeseiaceae bacterium]